MKKYIWYGIAALCFMLSACAKKENIAKPKFIQVFVRSKPFVGTPPVHAYVNDKLIGGINPGGAISTLLKLSNQPVELSIRNPATGEILLDSAFVPRQENNFTILIDDVLGIRQFYTQPAIQPRPVAVDSFRIQLIHKIEYMGKKRTVTFKVFEDVIADGLTQELHELPIQVTVPYGQISTSIDIPYEYSPVTGYGKGYVLKAYDTSTGELLVDAATLYDGRLEYIMVPPMYKLIFTKVRDTPGTGTGLTWDFSYQDAYDPLQ